jgi:hypothetical protein
MKYTLLPGERTVFCISIFFIALSLAFDVWEWIDSNYGGCFVVLSGWTLFACVYYVVSRCLIPALGLMSVYDSVSLYWAGFFMFGLPGAISNSVIDLFEIESP